MSDVNRDTRLATRTALVPFDPGDQVTSGQTWPGLGLPRLPTRLVSRPAKYRRLDRLAAVTIVEALPGFGKTTLLADWARQQQTWGSHVVWIRASRELDDLATFMHCLHEGMLLSGALHQSVPAPRNGDRHASWTDDIARSSSPVIVVVDDAHLLRSPEVVDTLLGLVARTHPLNVVAAADTDHHFRTIAARHDLETNVLHAADLSVPASAVPAFAAAWGHHLDLRSAEVLHDLVGGWLLPLQLVLDATPRLSPRFATHAADDFLMKQVLPDITDTADLATAARFAVPETLDIDLAAALLHRGETAEPPSELGGPAVSALERRGLLWRVPNHDGPAQWRFPRLVRRALLEQFELTSPGAAKAAHREVAHLLLARGATRAGELLRHARAAGEWALLAQLWEQHGWSLSGQDARAFEAAYAGIPEAARLELPSLTLAGTIGDALAATSEDAGWMQRAESLLRQYMQVGDDFVNGPRHRGYDHAELAELFTAAMISRRTDGHLGDALRLAASAEREFTRARAQHPDRMRTSQEAWFHLQNAVTQLQGGHFSTALELAATTYQMSPNNLIGSAAAGLLAALNGLSGQAADTAHWLGLHDSIDLSGHWAAEFAQLPARLARAMQALDRLDRAAADAELEGLTLGEEASGLWPVVLSVHTRYALIFGDPVATLPRLDHLSRVLSRHLRHRDSIGWQVFDRCTADLTLALGEVNRLQSRLGSGHDVASWLLTPAALFHLITGNPRTALRIASAGGWRDDVHARERANLLVISALANHALGKQERSVETFRQAHALVQDSGNLEALLILPAAVRAELLDAAGLQLHPGVEARLQAIGSPYPEHAELIQLSPRELEVLRQIRSHETAAGLARTLSVSVNTVKKQLVSLYAKLDVHDRSSALLRAQRLGLIDERPEHERGI